MTIERSSLLCPAEEFLSKNSEEALKIACDAASSKADDGPSAGHSKLEDNTQSGWVLVDELLHAISCRAFGVSHKKIT
jgi:hypothetical protein